MLIARNGYAPQIASTAAVACSAAVVGNVRIGPGAYIDHGAVVESGGPLVEIDEEAIVFAGAIVRSVGGASRPPFAVEIGQRAIISPSCVLTGCRIGNRCYVATGAIVLQGATLGDDTRLAVGAIVHAGTNLPERARVGIRHIAVPTPDGFLSTPDIEQARAALANSGFFTTAFDADEPQQSALHAEVSAKLLAEVQGWNDDPG